VNDSCTDPAARPGYGFAMRWPVKLRDPPPRWAAHPRTGEDSLLDSIPKKDPPRDHKSHGPVTPTRTPEELDDLTGFVQAPEPGRVR